MADQDYKLLSKDDQTMLAERMMRTLEEQIFALEFDVTANEAADNPAATTDVRKRLEKLQRALAAVRLQYAHLFPPKAEEVSE